MPIHLNCPKGHALRVKDKLAGQAGTCPTCGAPFVVPAPSDQTITASQPEIPAPQPAPAAGDAVEAATEWRVTLPDGSQFGPTVAVVFAQWIAAGRVPADALVWRTGWAEWRRAADAASELPTALPGGPESPASPPAPIVPRGASLPPAAVPVPVALLSGGSQSSSEVSYSLRKKREARRRQKFVLGLTVACLVLAAMLVGLMWSGPPANAPVISH